MSVTLLSPGTVFAGDYKVIQPLSEGGMGSVYIVEQISTGKQRALKLMLPQLVADPRLRARFEQEARIGSRIDSEHVVEVVAAGIDQTAGVPWLAMELLRGETLAAYIARQGPLPARSMLEIMEQVCHAIGAAHDAGIVHRDLKPENIFVAQARRTGSNYMIKVLDFGIAKVVADAKTSETAAIGSPMWMAPEQTMRGSEIMPQTDVWSIGLIVFHLLTRRLFWRAAEDEQASITHVLREIAIDPIPPISQRAMEVNCQGAFPPGFDAWFARSLDRSVHNRFPNANVQLAELRRVFAPWVTAPMSGQQQTPAPTPSVPRTVPQVPLYGPPQQPHPTQQYTPPQPQYHSTTGGMGMAGAPPPSRSGGGSVLPFVIGGLLLVTVGGGVLLLTVGKSLLTSATSGLADAAPTETATTPPAPTTSATAEKPSLNAWITVAGATGPLKLGVADEKSNDFGFRPSRNILAPKTSYDIQQHEVTWAEIEPYLTEHPDQSFVQPKWLPLSHDKLPATNVPWNTALSYCKSIKGTLPTEEQWEFAARGPELHPHPWGDQQIDLGRMTAFVGEKVDTLVLKAATLSDQDQTPGDDAHAIEDMAGNAMEWTIDLYREDKPGQNEHWVEEGGLTFRTVRGLPVAMAIPAKLPVSSAAYRTALCATGPCPADTSKVLMFVGFRCVRRK